METLFALVAMVTVDGTTPTFYATKTGVSRSDCVVAFNALTPAQRVNTEWTCEVDPDSTARANGFTDCVMEDSTNCVWDATTRGNGLGQSFIDVNGVSYLFDSL